MRVPLRLKLFAVVLLGVLAPSGVSLLYALKLHREGLEEAFLRQGRTMFNQVMLTRRWLARHGGVYVRKHPFVKESPYMEGADTATLQGEPIILRSPDLVTREMSELSGKEGALKFRVVSLDPINPENAADPWEARALESFEKGRSEAFSILGGGPDIRVRYMAPVRTEADCMRCHQEYGYEVGRVRGGISLEFPVGELLENSETVARNMIAGFVVLGAMIVAFLWLGTNSLLLKPLSEVSRAVAGMREGDYSRPLQKKGNDEIGDLAEAVAETREFIRNYNAALESEVKARTEQLEEINRTLEAKVEKQTAALLEHERMAALGEVSAGLAHEIRNPLSAILSGVSLLESPRRTPEERERIIMLIKREARRLNASLTDFLLFARPKEPKKVRIDLNGLVREVARLLEEDPEIKGEVEISLELDPLPPVWFDDDQLRQIVWNVSLNALQAMEGKGALVIRTSRENGMFKLEVSDTGHGIPPEMESKVFEPFFSTKGEGTGLGLSIVKRIVNAHGGVVFFECRQGGGCTFTIKAPIGNGPDDEPPLARGET